MWQQSWFGARALPQPSSDFLQKAESFEFLLQRFRRKQTLQFHIDSNHGNFYGISAFQTPQRVDPISHPCVIFPSESSHLTFSNSGPQVDRSPRAPTWLPVCIFLGQRITHHIACSHRSLGKQGTRGEQRCPIASSARSSTQLAHNLCKVAMTKTYMSVLCRFAFLARVSKNMSYKASLLVVVVNS